MIVRVADGSLRDIACDGVLFTGRFVPEAALVGLSHLRLEAGSGGPAIDQFGRCSDPSYFAAGNLLRPIGDSGLVLSRGALRRRIRRRRSRRPPARCERLGAQRSSAA